MSVEQKPNFRNRRRKMHRSHMRTNNRQVKNDPNYRQPNDIHHILRPNQTQNPYRKNRLGGYRPRAQYHRRQFELNRNGGNGVRQRIQFNNANTTYDRQLNRNRGWRQHHLRFNIPITQANTINPTLWPITNVPDTSSSFITTTSRPRPTTTLLPTSATPILSSNDVTHFDDSQYQRQLEEAEQQRYEEKLRRTKESIDNARRIEQERIQNEERMRAIHQKELERRHQEMIDEQQHAQEIERIQNEKKLQDLRRREENEMNRLRYEEEQRIRQTELMQQNAEKSTNQRAIQTNEILEENISTTLSPADKKKLKLKRLRDRLNKLSPEAQEIFFRKRAERNKKRGVEHQEQFDRDEN